MSNNSLSILKEVPTIRALETGLDMKLYKVWKVMTLTWAFWDHKVLIVRLFLFGVLFYHRILQTANNRKRGKNIQMENVKYLYKQTENGEYLDK